MSRYAELASRIQGIQWKGKPEFRKSQARLTQEYLRRSALWTQELGTGGWPFYDIAHHVNPEVRAPSGVIEETLSSLAEYATFYVARTVEWALHFAALKDTGEELPKLPGPFSPLIAVYERGDAINYTPSGFIEVGGLTVTRGQVHRYAQVEPLEDFSENFLQKMDEEGQSNRHHKSA
ncbi:hypothetical protein HNR06_001608 [Nocardiopsis arvandica]|uniref:Uncharacterized protein n=1 Tax=Nocardiopsis sinuspersici TaxID=501010 RepID=A0A7Y9XAK2_9ACTN|nr:hypothetical protein [Nocardiopsis sinuspersici]NYH52019.1 hypothetical protein [Nocardiopsis sinuspersici]